MPGAFLNSRRPGLAVAAVFLAATILGSSVAGCGGHAAPPVPAPVRERLLYDEQGIRIGIQDDPSVGRSTPPAANSHPARLTADAVRVLLGSFQMRPFWAGLVGNKRPIPVFTANELQLISAPISTALAQAGPSERVFFSIPDLAVTFNTLRTNGAVFLRGPYLHVALTDHMEFAKAELSLAKPVQPVSLTPEETPLWGADEKAHFSLNVKEVLATGARSPSSASTSVGPPALADGPEGQPSPAASPEDLHRLVRELTNANGDLRTRLREQAQTIDSLTKEVARLRRQLTEYRTKPGTRRKSAPPSGR